MKKMILATSFPSQNKNFILFVSLQNLDQKFDKSINFGNDLQKWIKILKNLIS